MTKPTTDAAAAAAKPSRQQKPKPTTAEAKGGKLDAAAPDRKPSRGDRYPYDPSCCEKVVKLGADGLCAVEIRREIGLPRSAWNRWIEQFPEFKEAVEARSLRQMKETAMQGPRIFREREGQQTIDSAAIDDMAALVRLGMGPEEVIDALLEKCTGSTRDEARYAVSIAFEGIEKALAPLKRTISLPHGYAVTFKFDRQTGFSFQWSPKRRSGGSGANTMRPAMLSARTLRT